MALSFPTKQTPPQANRSATYSLIAHSKVALATITTFQHGVVRTQNAGPAFSNGPQRHTECYTYPDTNGIMSACGYLKKKCKNPEHRPMKAGAVGENITCLFHFSSLTSSRQSVPLHARRGHFISPCEFVRKHLASWSWNPDLCGRVRTSLPPPPCNDGNTMSQTSIGGKRGLYKWVLCGLWYWQVSILWFTSIKLCCLTLAHEEISKEVFRSHHNLNRATFL